MSKLKDVRQMAKLTQAQLAEQTDLNIRTIQHYEQGTKIFDHARIDTLLKVCIALNCKLEDILENEEYIKLLHKYES